MATDDGALRDEERSKMASWYPVVTSFCCCCGLESGARSVGLLHVTAALLLVAGSSYYSHALAGQARLTPDAEDAALYARFHRLAAGAAVASVVHVLLGATLLYGAVKRHTGCLRAWTIIMSCLWALALLAALLLPLLAAAGGAPVGGAEIFLSFSIAVLFFAVVGYCIISVNSFYLMAKSSEDMDGPKYDY